MIKKLTRVEPEPPWSFYGALGAFVAMFFAIIIGTTIAEISLSDSPTTIITGWSIGMVLTIIFVMISRHMRSVTDAEALKIGPTKVRLGVIFVFAISIAVTYDLISWAIIDKQIITATELATFSQRDALSISNWVMAALFMVILQPIGEGLVLRGMLFPAVRTAFGAWGGLTLTAIFHTGFHFAAYPPDAFDNPFWYGIIMPFLIGLFIAGVRAHTGSTRAAIIAHAGFGLFAIAKVLTLG